jgi:hypothetical protein
LEGWDRSIGAHELQQLVPIIGCADADQLKIAIAYLYALGWQFFSAKFQQKTPLG